VTITTVNPIGCTEQVPPSQVAEERIPLSSLPKLVWVGGTLFVANLVIGLGMLITPNLETDPYGAEVRSYDVASGKMSPFTEVVDTKRRPVRMAAKARPVTFVPAEEDTSTYASLDLPSSMPRSAELDLSPASSRQLDIPLASARVYEQLNMPVRTEHAVYRPGESTRSTTPLKVYDNTSQYDMPRSTYVQRSIDRTRPQQTPLDVAPRRVSEKSSVVIN
jgi:hypothetical protein